MSVWWKKRGLFAVTIAVVLAIGGALLAYRMQDEPESPALAQQTVSTVATVAVTEASDASDELVDELQPRGGERPLAPLIRVAEQALEHIDNDIRDYSATIFKRERVGGKLLDPQTVHAKIRHQPFSAYLCFVDPFEGQECLFVQGENNGNMLCRAGDWRKSLGVVALSPTGMLAMRGQRYPVLKLGIRNLTDELRTVASEFLGLKDCQVVASGGQLVDGRPATLIEVTLSKWRPKARFSTAKIYIDNELRIPVRYASWSWPKKPGQDPPLEEEYAYTKIQINQGFTDETFSQENPDIFR